MTGGNMRTVAYGKAKLRYALLQMPRKSLEIAVHPDKTVVVKAPVTVPAEKIDARVLQRARWIKRQIAYFARFEPRTLARLYVGGASHPYLGRFYRLKIAHNGKDEVALKNGYFYISCKSGGTQQVKSVLEAWYRSKALALLSEVFNDCWRAFDNGGIAKPLLALRKMRTRWGSLSASGRLTLNVNLIKTPKECVEYVVMHELCHLVHFHHGARFYELLDEKMPDWAERKHKLEMSLA